jgi:hypothetical protein
MTRHVDRTAGLSGKRLAYLERKTAELERRLAEAHAAPRVDARAAASHRTPAASRVRQPRLIEDAAPGGPDSQAAYDLLSELSAEFPAGSWDFDDPTDVIVTRGRASAYRRGFGRAYQAAAGAGVALLLAIILAIVLSGSGAAWPASVPVVQGEVTTACQNPNVRSEPDQVDFACGRSTEQVLWVFALLTSNDNPRFSDPRTGRRGLEPITPAQGGEVAWSLNLHHPYNPASPIDSLAVAARAINNIVGGATLTSGNGKSVVQPGLESVAANCLRYTGSSRLVSRAGFPASCARPVTSPAGQAALVADIYRHWVVGAVPAAARDAAVLFENAKNPGAPQVQAILKHLPNRKLLA